MEINKTELIEWLLDGETGMSSKNIVRVIITGKTDGSHPHDPADLRRCIELINRHQGLRMAFFADMPKVSSVWKELVEIWPLLESTLRYEMKNNKDGKAPKTYDLMKEAILRGSIEGGPKRKGA